ncbi:MAG: CoA transferase [Glaciimonas sp.]|nr:CoA transferase [Glaciimonas sp.]
MQNQTSLQAAQTLWSTLGLPSTALSQLTLTGSDPILPSSFAVGVAAQASIAVSTLVAAEIGRLRGICSGDGNKIQQVSVDMRHALAEFRSERYLRINDAQPEDPWDKIAGAYRCGDGRWVRLHTNFPHHRDGVLKILDCAHDKVSVERSLQRWRAEDVENAAAEAGVVVAAMRSFAEWDQHPQGIAVQSLPVLSIEKIADAPARPLSMLTLDRPLDGVRVLDLTRVIAGPVCGRTLAAHGADVLQVSAPYLPSIAPLVMDNGRGKRSCFIDLKQISGQATLNHLLKDADVFVQGYRPNGMDALGFSPEAVAAQRPGIVYVSLSAYGHVGPWAQRRGFDSLVQTASGFNHAEAHAAHSDEPKPLPAQVLDHAAGYLMAYGGMVALTRRITEGGSWHVRVSLAQTGHWLRQLGRVENGLHMVDQRFDQIGDLLEQCDSGFGRLTAVRHAAQLSATPARWTLPSVPLGTHPAHW